MTWKISAALAILLNTSPAFGEPREPVTVDKREAQTTTMGDAKYFTGEVHVTSRFQRDAPARIGGGLVSFSAGARTAWHTHPLGQTLIVTAGEGWVQNWGGEPQRIRSGDVVWIPPGVKHWHGATQEAAMSHIAVAEALDGRSVDWLAGTGRRHAISVALSNQGPR